LITGRGRGLVPTGGLVEQAEARELLAAARAETVARLAGLEREFQGILESAGSAGDDDEHDPEGATVAFERQHVAALLDQAREQLAQIDRAEQRLAEGSYGVCERCGQPIGAERLAARPVATVCIRCASQASRRP
jgi:RNA polymerase-binding protein DksA